MKYYFTTILNTDFDTAVSNVTEALKSVGFGVLSEINIHDKLKEKLNVDFRKYRVLGACNPAFAYKALQAEDKIGTMLPCNVIVQEHEPNKIEVTAVDPVASMYAIENESLVATAQEVRAILKKVIESL